MNKRLLTPWFDGRIYKPARKGVYMQMSGTYPGYQYWNGRHWSSWSGTVKGALTDLGYVVDEQHQNDDWRGIASDLAKQP